jgi:glycosyltransferase involved in cell wall biosynthesis
MRAMITSSPKIFVDDNEFDFACRLPSKGDDFKLDAGTSVAKLKAHFYETLADLGEIRRFSRKDAVAGNDLAQAISSPGAFVASFHEVAPELPCRLLQHTKGALMMPGGFLDGWTLRDSTVSIVTSRSQASRLLNAFRDLQFATMPFYPRLDNSFQEPDRSVHDGVASNRFDVDLIYAGRWIANKGIAQVVRAINLWPCDAKSLRLIGGFEHNFPLSQGDGQHSTFAHFFQREILGRNRLLNISTEAALPPETLACRFRNSRVFLYPSFHEDENYGMAPREAALCGAIPIVSDICGLGEFGQKASGGLLKTWSTLGGIRYSLRALSDEVSRVLSWKDEERQQARESNRRMLNAECCPDASRDQLLKAMETLLDRPVAPPPEGGWRCQTRIETLATRGPESFREAFSYGPNSDPEGLYVEGLGYRHEAYSEAQFLAAIQGIYTTWPTPPRLLPGARLHGFWRVALWEYERALVEFGFPGPRLLRFSDTEWASVRSAACSLGAGELEFEIRDDRAAVILQRAIDLGYLVPNQLDCCILPPPNDTLPHEMMQSAATRHSPINPINYAAI